MSTDTLDAAADLVFISPHFDDVPLSCGGFVTACAEVSSPRIVTIFGGTPPASTPRTPFSHALVAEWGAVSLAEAIRMRRAEDAAAAAVLGASLVTLSFADGAFRGESYPDWPALQGTLAPADAALPGQIADALRRAGLITPRTTLIGPLGAGNHVDHQAVFAALPLLAPEVAHVWLYEDFPYAAQRADAVTQRRAAVGLADATPRVLDIAPWLPTKIRAIACYPSQLPLLFPDTSMTRSGRAYTEAIPNTSMAEAVRTYAEAVAEGTGAAERFWPLHRSP